MTIEKLANSLRIKTKSSLVSLSKDEAQIGEMKILTPGEYEKDGIFMDYKGPNLLWIFADKMRIARVEGSDFDPKLLEDLGGVDILLVEDESLIREIEPRLAVLIPKLTEKLNIKEADLPTDSTKILP